MNTEEYGCGRCGKKVEIVDGKLTCCGVTETLTHVRYVASKRKRRITEHLFDPVLEIYNDDGTIDYEGIPNT